jgi:protein PhnA
MAAGAGRTLRQGTGDQVDPAQEAGVAGDPQEIDCKFEGIKGLVQRAEFVRKR